MDKNEIIEQLESLIDDRNSFIDPTDTDENNIFRKDKQALKEAINIIKKQDKVIQDVYREANNVLYFDDSSDFICSLWTILNLINPQLEAEDSWELHYIEEEE